MSLLALSTLLAACGGRGQAETPPAQPACQLIKATPGLSPGPAFVDPLMSIKYLASKAGACGVPQLRDARDTVVKTRTVAASEWKSPEGGIVGMVTLEAEAELARESTYALYLGELRMMAFTTGTERRGALTEAVDAPAKFGGLPATSRVEKDDINGLLKGYLKFLTEEHGIAGDVAYELLRAVARYELPSLSSPGATYAAQIKRVVYRSADATGQPVAMSGLLVYPLQATGGPAVDYNGLPIVLGQRGAARSDAPAPSSGANYMLLPALLAAGKGHVALVPDLIGQGDSARLAQSFLIGTDTAAQTEDLLLAGREYFLQHHRAQLGQDLRVLGLSQGGFSAIAALPHLARMGTVRQVVAAAGPFDLQKTLDATLLAAAGQPRPPYAVDADLSRIPDYLVATLTSLAAYQGYRFDPKTTFDDKGQPLPDFLKDYRDGKHRALGTHLAINSPASGSLRYDLPAAQFRFYRYGKDSLISPLNSDDMIATLTAPGQRVGGASLGSCREGSELVKLVLKHSKSKSTPHTICMPFVLNDFVGGL
ncbi:hypothetical protein [Mitsuaria sp. GD03876]|uniref:hypothetical protein n=1 Tax=Mitsuaria sp. GD03876 TaxID=2975399 RepID=UPI00244B6A20|nr:hypothetical protein [Mitsuaria sp. GD03876]MDH0867905.1 alpha/beta hydrolase [Mitsuaria sp. GD03876]